VTEKAREQSTSPPLPASSYCAQRRHATGAVLPAEMERGRLSSPTRVKKERKRREKKEGTERKKGHAGKRGKKLEGNRD